MLTGQLTQAVQEDPVPPCASSKQIAAGPFAKDLSLPFCVTTTTPKANRNKLVQNCVFPFQHVLAILITK